jgi:signal transduction histidine kinase
MIEPPSVAPGRSERGGGSNVTSALLPTRELDVQRPAEPARSEAALTQVAWSPREALDLAEWSAVGRRFGEIGRCSQWWLGDWINYGNQRFGERYTRAVKLTGYDVQSLMNMVYVASRFEIYRRRENLSWSHHSTLAALDVDRQEYWLERATADKLSVADLRVELRGRRRALEASSHTEDRGDGSGEGTAGGAALVCPHCGGAVPLSG